MSYIRSANCTSCASKSIVRYRIALPIAFLLLNMFSFTALAQQTTYSKYEEKMLQYVNNQEAYAWKYDSLSMITRALDSCSRFLEMYPRSFAKPGVLAFMLKMTAEITKDTARIFPLIDSVLYYDSLPVTKYDIANMLIEKDIDKEKAHRLLMEAYPGLTNSYHRFKANILFARIAIAEGFSRSAVTYFDRAMAADSTRIEGWMEYASYLRLSEQPAKLPQILDVIHALEKKAQMHYETYPARSPNIDKSVVDITLPDINHKPVEFKQFLGKPLIIQNFNFWCGYPDPGMPIYKKLTKEFPGTKVIFVDLGETREELQYRYLNKPVYRFLKSSPIVFIEPPYPYRTFDNQVASSIVLVDKNGRVRAEYPGYNEKTESLLRKQLQMLSLEK